MVIGPAHDSIEMRTLVDGVEYRLPRRDLGVLRVLGAILLLVGLIFFGTSGLMCAMAIRALVFGATMQGSPPTWPMLAILLAFLGIGLSICSAGLGLFTGRSTVRIHGDRLVATHTLGLFRRRSRVELSRVTALSVVRGQTSSNGPVTARGVLPELSMLVAESPDATKPVVMAIGYPAELLRALADEIGADRNIESRVVRGVQRRRHLPILDRLKQPTASKVIVERTSDQLILTVPPSSVFKGSGGVFVFSLVWFAFCAAFTIGMGSGAANHSSGSVFSLLLSPLGLFIGVFWLAGLGTMIGAINMARRHAIIDVLSGRTVMINCKTLLGAKQHQWDQEQIKRVCAGPNGMTVNNRSITELQFYVWPKREGRRRKAKKFGLFAGRDADELDWLAEMINHEIGRD